MSLWLSGIGVSRGIVIGPVQRLHGAELDVPEYTIRADALNAEKQRFRDALQQAHAQLETIRQQIPANAPAEIGAFIDTHILMMQDTALSETVTQLIDEHLCNAEWALAIQRDNLTSVFDQMDDAYLKTRRDDIVHVTARIQRVLLEQEGHISAGSGQTRRGAVIVADDITPADIILLHQQRIAAFMTKHGGPLSHSAIMARSLRIPAIMGLHEAPRLLLDGDQVIIDGETGDALVDPDASALTFYHHRQERDRRYQRMLAQLKTEPAISADGATIRLLASVELPDDSKSAAEVGAEGIGLYRTEFLYMNREDMPGEEEQLAAYTRVLHSVDGPVTIRTLDLGADKTISGHAAPATSPNPALGLRAIRLCLKDTGMFRVQLRALLRASAEGDLRIMLPMISNVQEMRQTRHLISELKTELRHEGLEFNPAVAVGAMIEVPAAALAAPQLARHADFFSLGTNDLIQYTLAMDRIDDEINYLYDPLHPAVLQLIKLTIDAGMAAGIPVAMCGEMASDRRYTHLLLGLGLTEFSMHPANLLEVKSLIRHADIGALKAHVASILGSNDAVEYRELLDELDKPVTT